MLPTYNERENIEVVGSHCGLGHNPAAMWVVADRLALPDGSWRDITFSDEYATAMSLIVLQFPNNHLPIFQR